MKTKKLSKADWEKVLGLHRLFTVINEAVIKNYATTDPVQALDLIFSSYGIVCDGVATLYPNNKSDNAYFVRVERVEEKTTYHLDLQTMPEGEGGFLYDALAFKEPEIVPNIVNGITKSDLAALPWLADMRTALIVPTIGVKGEPATSILFAHEEDAYKFDDIWRNVILTYSITNVILNLLLRRETDKAYRALDEELNIIGHIQRQLLPEKLPSTDGLEWAAYYSTSARAGGDYYDFFPLPDDRIGVIIADVSGHGSPAAVVMAMTRLLMHTYPGEINPPVEVMKKMNEILMGHILPGQFVTAFYGVIDLKDRTLTCSSAGHCHPRVFRSKKNTVEKMEVKGGLPLGVSSDGGFDQTSIEFDKDDVLLFYTDGLTEAMDKTKEMYGESRLEKVLSDLSGESAIQIKNFLLEDVTGFTKGTPLKDDMTIIVARSTK